MPIYDIVKGLVDFAQSVLDLGTSLQKLDADARDRTAGCLDAIVSCLDRIATSARSKDRQRLLGSCEELGIYLANFGALHIPELMDAGREALLRKLTEAVQMRRGLVLGNELWIDNGNASLDLLLTNIERAAGAFRAASALLRGMSTNHGTPAAMRSTRSYRRRNLGTILSLGVGAVVVWLFASGWARHWWGQFYYYACDRDYIELSASITTDGHIQISAHNPSLLCEAKLSDAKVRRPGRSSRVRSQRLDRVVPRLETASRVVECQGPCEDQMTLVVSWWPFGGPWTTRENEIDVTR